MRPCNFFYNVTGEEAERLLRAYGCDGEFLARPSESQPLNFTLSIIRGMSITHVKIQNNGVLLDLFGGESFASLSELVQYYMDNPEQLQEKNGGTIIMRRPISIPLHEPAAQEARAPSSQRWFHANITGGEAVQLLAKEKQWTFLVRESQRAPGSYAITVKTTDDHVVHILIQKNTETGMFHVGGGDEFRTVSDLLAHYNNNPMVEEGSQRVVHLINLIPSTCVPADAIDERIRLLQEYDPHSKKGGFAEEFERIQQADDQLYSRREGKKEQNINKNRYKNIVPYDHTRVILKDVGSMESDYINANYIKIPEGPPLHLQADREYISTQGCLPHTVIDFWRMVWQENSRVIVMTTKELERTRSKCHPYWPPLEEELTVKAHRPPLKEEYYYIKTVEETVEKDDHGDDSFIRRRFMVSRGGSPLRELFHLQFVGWPDHGCPEHPEAVLKFLDAVDEACKRAIATQGPVVVHCSAGIGRTGTFIVIDVLLNQIRHRGGSCPIDIPRTVMCIREQRSGMVQTEAQYGFLYKAISCYIASTCKTRHSSAEENLTLPTHLPPPPLPRRSKPVPDQAKAYVNNT